MLEVSDEKKCVALSCCHPQCFFDFKPDFRAPRPRALRHEEDHRPQWDRNNVRLGQPPLSTSYGRDGGGRPLPALDTRNVFNLCHVAEGLGQKYTQAGRHGNRGDSSCSERHCPGDQRQSRFRDEGRHQRQRDPFPMRARGANMHGARRTCLMVRPRIKNLMRNKAKARCVVLLLSLMLSPYSAFVMQADTGGSISGTVTDQTGAVVPDTTVTALNLDTTVQQTTKTNTNGLYACTPLPVGRYEIEILRQGFKPYKRTGLVIDVNAALREDIGLTVGEQSEEVVVSDTAVHVETESSQMGEVVTGAEIPAVALNGRSFTDLLSLQPSIVPMSTQTNDSVVMAGVTVAITPSGNLNAGIQSINGQREDANGFLVNGSDVKEEMNGGTSIIMNLDSISEFRVLTNNFDPEYGNYAGGIVNAVTKSGTDQFHGDAFEFLRNTALDAKSFFSTHRQAYDQNQFGGTIGGPIKKGKLFFFGDYQGTRTTEGLDTGQVTVPSL